MEKELEATSIQPEKKEFQPGIIDWSEHQQKFRVTIEKLPLKQLKRHLEVATESMELYDHMYGNTNHFSKQAEMEIVVLRKLIDEREKNA